MATGNCPDATEINGAWAGPAAISPAICGTTSTSLAGAPHEFENALEVFYNFAVTPATHVSVDLEVIKSAASAVDTAVVIGTRYQFDF